MLVWDWVASAMRPLLVARTLERFTVDQIMADLERYGHPHGITLTRKQVSTWLNRESKKSGRGVVRVRGGYLSFPGSWEMDRLRDDWADTPRRRQFILRVIPSEKWERAKKLAKLDHATWERLRAEYRQRYEGE